MNDFIEYSDLESNMNVITANDIASVQGCGTVILNCPNLEGGHNTVRIMPVFYMPDLTSRLLSMGSFLQKSMEVHGGKHHINLYKAGKCFIMCVPHMAGDSLYWLRSPDEESAANIFPTIFKVDYGIMHRRFGHPSRDMLKHARYNTQ